MKICWDNLEKIRFSKKSGTFRYNNTTWYECDACETCGDPFLNQTQNGRFCDKSCANYKDKNPRYGKISTQETRQKQSDAIGGENHPFYGKYGKNSAGWKGGYCSRNIPRYDLYAPQLESYEECRRNKKDPNILEVKCVHCKTWFIPTIKEVKIRKRGIDYGMGYFYCLDSCKEACPLFGRSAKYLMKQDAIKASRISLKELKNEVPGWFKKEVLKLDNHRCLRCGDKATQVHHEIPQKRNPLLVVDKDNCVSLCTRCHKWVHMNIEGCRYQELRNIDC